MIRPADDATRLAAEAIEHGALQKPEELSQLVAYLHGRALSSVLEIGTASGGTFFLWCRLADPEATIISIDLPDGPFGGCYAAPIDKLRSYGLPGQELHFLRADSHARATRDGLTRLLGNRGLDLLFIDGDHTYEGVRTDFYLYAPLVRPGGVIVFHDIVETTAVADVDVKKLWTEVKDKHPNAEIVCDAERATWGGFGILRL